MMKLKSGIESLNEFFKAIAEILAYVYRIQRKI